jgi:hypothetical protein
VKLPHAELAVIETEKIRDYLLSASHPIGRFKAPVFQAMGYRQDQWEQLAADLREQHALSEVDEVVETKHGRKYVIRANLKGPNGRTFAMQSIWILLKDEDVPRFVTAYPGEE